MERYSLNVLFRNGAVIYIPCWSWEVHVQRNPRELKTFYIRPLDGFSLGWLPIGDVQAIWAEVVGPLTEEELETIDSNESYANKKVLLD